MWIVNGAKSSNSVSLTPSEWLQLLQHKDAIIGYLHGNYGACETTGVIAYDLQHHEILLKEVYSRRAVVVNECLSLLSITAAGDASGEPALVDISNILITADSINTSPTGSVRGGGNTSGGERRANKRSALDAARDAVAEKSANVVDSKRVKRPDFVGIAVHAPTVEAMFDLEDVVQLKRVNE